MNQTELQNALSRATNKFGIKTTSDSILFQADTQMDFGSRFDSSLYNLVRTDFQYTSQLVYEVALACEDWFERHYGHEFAFLGRFDRDEAKRQLELLPTKGFGYFKTLDVFDQAHTPKAYVTIRSYAKLPDFTTVDEGLTAVFGMSYGEAIDFLEDHGYVIFRKLPAFTKKDFKLQVNTACQSVEKDRPIEDFRRLLRKVNNVILDDQSNAESDLKEMAIKTKENLRRYFGVDRLNEDDKKIAVEELKLTSEWIEDLEEDSEIAYVVSEV